MSKNLPAVVERVGGELAKVFSNLENYTSDKRSLTDMQQRELARFVEGSPELNTEPRIVLLVDAIAWHGIEQLELFKALIDAYDLEIVYLALDYLYEEGERGRTLEQDDADADDIDSDNFGDFELEDHKVSQLLSDMKYIDLVSQYIVRVRESGVLVSDVEALSDYVYRNGGLDLENPDEDDDIATSEDEIRSY